MSSLLALNVLDPHSLLARFVPVVRTVLDLLERDRER